MKTIVSAIATASLVLSAGPAFAEEPRQMQIDYADLNLDTPAGQKALDQRIEKAARAVCGLDQQRTGTRLRSGDGRECFNNAKASAHASVAAAVERPAKGG